MIYPKVSKETTIIIIYYFFFLFFGGGGCFKIQFPIALVKHVKTNHDILYLFQDAQGGGAITVLSF